MNDVPSYSTRLRLYYFERECRACNRLVRRTMSVSAGCGRCALTAVLTVTVYRFHSSVSILPSRSAAVQQTAASENPPVSREKTQRAGPVLCDLANERQERRRPQALAVLLHVRGMCDML